MKYVFVFFIIAILSFSGCKEKVENTEPVNTAEPEKNMPYEETTYVPDEEKAETEEVLLSEARTVLLDKSENRISNIKIASESLNGFKIAPKDTFSFNEAVGIRSEERGYKKAAVLLYGEREYDYGGGVCQVSSTLFQAARNAGFEITEHHSHKKEVDYAKIGDDAAVNYDSLDLKFVNNSESEIIIYTGVYEEYMVVQIFKI